MRERKGLTETITEWRQIFSRCRIWPLAFEKHKENDAVAIEQEPRRGSSYFKETTRTVILSGALQGNWDIKGSLERLEGNKKEGN